MLTLGNARCLVLDVFPALCGMLYVSRLIGFFLFLPFLFSFTLFSLSHPLSFSLSLATPSLYLNLRHPSIPLKSLKDRVLHTYMFLGILNWGMEVKSLQNFHISFFSLSHSLPHSFSLSVYILSSLTAYLWTFSSLFFIQ